MRTRFNPKAIEEMNEFDRYIKDKDTIQKIIKENIGKKIYLEIGMGKGDFITQLCQLDKDNIYIGVEVSPPVLALAIKKARVITDSEFEGLEEYFAYEKERDSYE